MRRIIFDRILLNRRNIFKNLINVKHVINQEQSAANKRLTIKKKKHENADVCNKEKNSFE
jgi:hypothetical protein